MIIGVSRWMEALLDIPVSIKSKTYKVKSGLPEHLGMKMVY